MAKKRQIVVQQTFIKGITANKDAIINSLKNPETIAYAIKTGEYEDGKKFFTITIDNY